MATHLRGWRGAQGEGEDGATPGLSAAISSGTPRPPLRPPSPPARPHRLPRRPALPHHNGGPPPSPPRLRDPDVGGARSQEGCPISFRAASETAGAAHQNAEGRKAAGPRAEEERELCLECTSGGMPGLLRSHPSLISIGGERQR